MPDAIALPAPDQRAERAFDDHEDFIGSDILAARGMLRGIPVRLDCGRDDPFIVANRAVACELADAAVTFDDGAHTKDYWTAHAGAQMRWLAAQFR